MAVRASHALLGYAAAILVARLLGAQSLGVYAFSFAIASIIAIPGQYGIATLVTRETARQSQSEDWALLKGVWQWALAGAILVSVMLVSIAGIFIWSLGKEPNEYSMTLYVSLFLVLPLALMGCIGARLRGFGAYVIGQLPEYVFRPLLFIVILASSYSFVLSETSWPGPGIVMSIQVLSAFLALLVAALILRTRSPRILRSHSAAYKSRDWTMAVLPFVAISGVQFVITYTDIIMLGLLRTAADVGLYRVASQTSLLVAFFLQAVTSVVGPQFARAYYANDLTKLQKIIDWSAKLIIGLTLPFSLILIIAASPIVTLVFGEDFSGSALPLKILICGQLGNVIAGSVSVLLSMSGHERESAIALSVFALANIVFNALLIPLLGLVGASISTAICMIGWNIVLHNIVRSRVGVEPSPIVSYIQRRIA